MRLLIITQKVDKNDPVLSFFHRWIEEFATYYNKITVICLEKGMYDLPKNVKVLSLGKERKRSNVRYIAQFYKYIWQERKNYNSVFVHMNQEYVVLGGLLWKLWRKKTYLWRNHAKGNFLTRIAVVLSDKVFCTSPQSYTARFKKTQIMPVGIDTDFFKPDLSVSKESNSILFLGRISPVKKVLEFIDWLHDLDKQGRQFIATVAGDSLPRDAQYKREVREKVSKYGLASKVKFTGPVIENEALKLYQSHETYVNMTPRGSMDKTILEAAACEMILLVDNQDIKDILKNKKGRELRDFVVENHSLKVLMDKFNLVFNE